MACSRDTSKVKGPGQNKRFWTEEEDTKLIESLLEMHNEGTFKAEGNFKPGYLKALEKALATKIPGCDLQARPHIESRMKTLKTHFQIVHEMLTGPNCSGFGWDPQKQMVTAEKPVWEAYLQSHREATPFKNQIFPYYDDLCTIFGKDRATGKHAETPTDVEENEKEDQHVNLDDDNFNFFHTMGDTYAENGESMSFSQAQNGPRAPPIQSDGSSKKKRKSSSLGDIAEAIKDASQFIGEKIEMSSVRLSRAIGEEMNDKQMRVNEEIMRTTLLPMMDRHRAARMIMSDNALVSFFFSLPDEEKDHWVRALLIGAI
ncbi:hypothetical protein CsatB_017155 [Cannabis sativa]